MLAKEKEGPPLKIFRIVKVKESTSSSNKHSSFGSNEEDKKEFKESEKRFKFHSISNSMYHHQSSRLDEGNSSHNSYNSN